MIDSCLRPAAMVAFGLLTACSDSAPHGREAQTRTAPLLTPLPAAQIRPLLPNHIIADLSGHCLHGPVLVRPGGRFEAVDLDTGYSEGDYEIRDGAVAFDNHGAPDGLRFELQLFGDDAGRRYVREAGETGQPKPLRLGPPDKRLLTRALTACMAQLPPPAPNRP